MKVGKILLAIVLGIIALSIAWGLVTTVIGFLMGFLKTMLSLAIAVVVIGGLGWAILRLIGRKPLGSHNSEPLP